MNGFILILSKNGYKAKFIGGFNNLVEFIESDLLMNHDVDLFALSSLEDHIMDGFPLGGCMHLGGGNFILRGSKDFCSYYNSCLFGHKPCSDNGLIKKIKKAKERFDLMRYSSDFEYGHKDADRIMYIFSLMLKDCDLVYKPIDFKSRKMARAWQIARDWVLA